MTDLADRDPEPDDEDNGPWCRTLTNRSTT